MCLISALREFLPPRLLTPLLLAVRVDVAAQFPFPTPSLEKPGPTHASLETTALKKTEKKRSRDYGVDS